LRVTSKKEKRQQGLGQVRGVIMGRKKDEERYNDKVRKQRRELEEFAETETEWAGYLINWYKYKKEDMPDDEYRACAFFLNSEYSRKPGSLTLLYCTAKQCFKETPQFMLENAFDFLSYRFRAFAKVLLTGGI